MSKITPYKARQRRAVALDVVAQIRTHRFNAQQMTYVEFGTSELADKTGSLQPLLRKAITRNKPCTVCALGACFISTVRLYNDIDAEKCVEHDSIESGAMRRKLNQLFTPSEQSVIESSFEGQPMYQGSRGDYVDVGGKWFSKFKGEWSNATRYTDFLGELSNEETLSILMLSVASIANERITLDRLRRAVTLQVLDNKQFAGYRSSYLL